MASRYGVINSRQFEAARDDWTSYAERLEQYFAANDVDSAEKRRAFFLSARGAQTYQLVKILVSPNPTERLFGELVKLVKDHLQPKPSIIVERFTLYSRNRKEGESVAVTLNDMLRDRLVCGINDGHTTSVTRGT